MNVHVLFPTSTSHVFFSKENIKFLSEMITKEIAQQYNGYKVVIPDNQILLMMEEVFGSSRLNTIPVMNQEVVYKLSRSFINYSIEISKKNEWSQGFWDNFLSDKTGKQPYNTPKLNIKEKNRGLRFYYTNPVFSEYR